MSEQNIHNLSDPEDLNQMQDLLRKAIEHNAALQEKMEQLVNAFEQKNEQFEAILERNQAVLSQIQNTPLESSTPAGGEGSNIFAAIETSNQTVHADVNTLNENQLKFNADIEKVKKDLAQLTRWFLGLAGATLLIFIFCLIILFRGNGGGGAEKNTDNTALEEDPVEAETETTDDGVGYFDPDNMGSETIAAANLEGKKINEKPQQLNIFSPEEAERIVSESSGLTIDPDEQEKAAREEEKKNREEEKTEEEPEEKKPPKTNLMDPDQAERIIGARAGYAVTYLQRQNFERLAEKYFQPRKSVYFLPYGLRAEGLIFTNDEVVRLTRDSTEYNWGKIGRRSLVMNFQEYYEKYIYDVDFDSGAKTYYNELHGPGRARLTAAAIEDWFPECIFVEYYKSGKSLILVFEDPGDNNYWYISAIIHNQ